MPRTRCLAAKLEGGDTKRLAEQLLTVGKEGRGVPDHSTPL